MVGPCGKWSSPGGNVRKFSCVSPDLSVTWYFGKQKTWLFQGKEGSCLKESLINVFRKSIPFQPTVELGFCADSDPLVDQLFMQTDGCTNSSCLESFPVSDAMTGSHVDESVTEIASVKMSEKSVIEVAKSAKNKKETYAQESP